MNWLSNLPQQTTAEFEEVKRALIEEKNEAVKQLSLEHELEMVAMKERWQEEDSSRQEELTSLTQVCFWVEPCLGMSGLRMTARGDMIEKSFSCFAVML